ncbi:hypothetical protein GGD56_003093 [Rhizobium mongolense]|jgi:hypothetical protein|uniref:Uncharacterized protein n=1 Tax=Rhizobium mongolense TaxID=57676 RepID=A0ABR6IMY8_9HYPH|nr:hypothetical protein [Rhizobium mongolense]
MAISIRRFRGTEIVGVTHEFVEAVRIAEIEDNSPRP